MENGFIQALQRILKDNMSLLSIHKELEKKQYAESPLGKLERKLHDFYDEMVLRKEALPEDIAKQVYDIRDKNEKDQKDYIDMTLKRDKEAVGKMLFDTFTKELEILNNYKKHD